jgi:hypothetical protein
MVGREDAAQREREETGIRAAPTQLFGERTHLGVPGVFEYGCPDPIGIDAPAADIPAQPKTLSEPHAAT